MQIVDNLDDETLNQTKTIQNENNPTDLSAQFNQPIDFAFLMGDLGADQPPPPQQEDKTQKYETLDAPMDFGGASQFDDSAFVVKEKKKDDWGDF